MNSKHHVRLSTQGRKATQGHAKQPRPPGMHRRGYSYEPAHPYVSSSSSKPGHGGSKRSSWNGDSREEEGEEGGMTSFLQFCTTCDKQIVTPGNTILYCSEACRKKDNSRPPSLHTALSSPGPIPPAAGYFDTPPADIVPRRSPTKKRPASLSFADLTISDSSSTSDDGEGSHSRNYSGISQSSENFDFGSYAWSSEFPGRPRLSRTSTATDGGIPSLSHTPSSSIGTVASVPSQRPLPSRHDPVGGHYPTRSADLVMPSYPPLTSHSPTQVMKSASLKSTASTVTSLQMAEAGDVSYEKRAPSWSHHRQPSGSLKHLIHPGST